nr:Unknown Function [uncultured bacterium]
MTAEVALLNKNAVALAADSAVTIAATRGNKIYNAANKLFALSKCHPVGVMVYGNAEYMGVPWETIVKVYREQLRDRCFSTLQAAYDDFIGFLGSNDAMFGEATQMEHVSAVVIYQYGRIRERIRGLVEALIATGEGVAWCWPPSYDAEHEALVRATYKELFANLLDTVFEQLPLQPEDRQALEDIGTFLLTRNRYPSSRSGVVVAGFGQDEYFPVLRSAVLQGRIAGKLKQRSLHSVTIGVESAAAVVPFAQTDAVHLFIEGIDPSHAQEATNLVGEKMHELTKDILNSLSMEQGDRDGAEREWKELAERHLKDFTERAEQQRSRDYVDPLIDVIASLPKDELAAVAEALVNITSLRRKVSMDAETVGGPVDVVVISKGDGLIWISRKHYFRPELNQHFFHNYYRSFAKGGTDE